MLCEELRGGSASEHNPDRLSPVGELESSLVELLIGCMQDRVML